MRLRSIQPLFQLARERQALFLTANKTLFTAGLLEFMLDAVRFLIILGGVMERLVMSIGYILRLHELVSRASYAS